MVNTILKEADLFCPNSGRIKFAIYLTKSTNFNYYEADNVYGALFFQFPKNVFRIFSRVFAGRLS
ncbi:hypothetical protein GRC92_16835 [Streptococcus thermophilus]|nr:hypothetical protein [Streptococcus thermophilus]